MRVIILATHGAFARGIKDSMEMVMGKQEHIRTVCAYENGETEVSGEARRALEELPAGDEAIVVTDVFGGSVNNEFMKLLEEKKFYLVAGLSLPLLIELASGSGEDVERSIEKALENAKESMKFCNPLMGKREKEEEF